MFCKECKSRNTCITICPDVEKVISNLEVSQRELTLPDNVLFSLLEIHLREVRAPYLDRHSEFVPELKKRLKLLTRSQRKIVKLYYLEGLSEEEIADKLKIDYWSVVRALKRAILGLKTSQKS